MPANGKNKRKRNPRHKKDFQDRKPTFTSAVSYTHLRAHET